MARRLSHPAVVIAIGAAVGLVALVVVRLFFFGLYDVPSASMAPTLVAGDRVVLVRFHGRPELSRGDVVVLEGPDSQGGTGLFVKRVIGLPGETISFSGKQVVVNGTPLVREPLGDCRIDADGDETNRPQFLLENALYEERIGDRRWRIVESRAVPAKPLDPVVVPPGMVFVLGDNRDNSFDSRFPPFGMVPLDRLLGRVTNVAFSHKPAGGWRRGRTLVPVR